MHEHPGVLYKPLAGKSPMLETAAVWLDEAMTPVLRAFLDEAVQVTTAEQVKPGVAGVAE